MTSKPEDVQLSIASVAERDIDLLLLEEFAASPAFARWFADRAGLPAGALEVASAFRSVTESIGESDLEIRFRASNGTCSLLVENKIGASFQPRQAERYQERGRSYRERQLCQHFVTVLVAPSKYVGKDPESRKGFDAVVTYEELRSWFAEHKELGARSTYKQRLLTLAIEKAVFGYQLVEDAPVTDFWRAYWLLSLREAPELEMEEPVAKPSGAGFIYFRPSVLPREVAIVHKLRHGYIDLQFAGMAGQLPRLRSAFGSALLPGMKIERAAKSGVVRQKVAPLNTNRELQSQEGEVLACLRIARDLLHWYLRVRPSPQTVV